MLGDFNHQASLAGLVHAEIIEMSGIIVPVIPKQMFNFSYLGASASKTIIFHSALNVVPYSDARLLVRVHASSMVVNQTIAISAVGTDPSPDDTQEFTDLSTGAMSLSIIYTTAAGTLASSASSTLLPFLKVGLTATQSGSGGTAFMIELSGDLLLRE